MAIRYYARYENSILRSIGIGLDGEEITKEEYEVLSDEIRSKTMLMDSLYKGNISIDEVPEEWREEIQRRVDERITTEGEATQQKISGDELLSMIEGVL